MGKTLAATGGGATLVTIIAAIGWPALLLTAIVILAAMATFGWLMNDNDRAARFTTLLRHLPGRNPQIPRQRRTREPAQRNARRSSKPNRAKINR